jgi:hypothetical protein
MALIGPELPYRAGQPGRPRLALLPRAFEFNDGIELSDRALCAVPEGTFLMIGNWHSGTIGCPIKSEAARWA